jgi:hypothetical protein
MRLSWLSGRAPAFTLPGAAQPSDCEENFTTAVRKEDQRKEFTAKPEKFLYEIPSPAGRGGQTCQYKIISPVSLQ